ncbi:zinc finger protein 41 isoform X2 [Bombina bombina]|uniref:zinc finger protein 41 isoform X2 n=1 Tax=Bombina bombina TaxID=8345 RepID=UPI00235AFB68|nr:zinc finger protein 41 isoform X2 [Bombina bombina]
MNKHKKQMAERFLNHALGVIYLLTGEKYTIVKENSSHSSVHRLTGEVPVTFDDVAVYFSMEEWDYIEGHEEFYKDAMMKKRQKLSAAEFPSHKSPGHSDNNLDTESIVEEVADEKPGKTIPQVETQTDVFVGDDNDEIEIILNTEQTDLCITHQMGAVEQRDLDNIGPVEENAKNMLNGAQTEEPRVRRHLKVPEQKVCSNIHSDTTKTEIILNTEQSDDLCVKSQLDTPEQEVCDSISIELTGIHHHERIHSGEPVFTGKHEQEEKIIQLEEIHSEPYSDESFDEIMEVDSLQGTRDANSSYTTQHSQGTVSNYSSVEPILCTEGNFESLFMSSECEQKLCGLNNNFAHNSKGVKFHPHNVKNELADCTKYVNTDSSCDSYLVSQTEGKQYICQKCGKGFYDNSQNPHFAKNGVCQECAKVSSAKSNLVTKQISHTGRNTHLYQKFGKAFSFKSHQGIHTGEKAFVCRVCGQGFSARSSMLKHQQVHRGNRQYGSQVLPSTGEKTYVCHECGKGFPNVSSLITHNRIHTGERPFICQQCGRAFAQNCSLVRHQIVHTGAKPHVCQKCGKAYTRRTTLMMHQAKHV